MASKSELESEKSRLGTLKDNLKSCSTYLIKASTSANDLSKTIDNHYLVNDSKTTISEKADSIASEISNKSTYLKDTVIPAIDDRINDINDEIKKIEEEEEREREEREAARKASSIRFRW